MSGVRRLENEDEEKFWEAWIKDDLIFCYRYGKLGSNGHTKLKKFKTRAEAEAELEQKLQEKLDEGFAEPGAEEAEEEDDEAAEEEAADAEEEAEAEEGAGGEEEGDADDEEDEDEDEEEDEEEDEAGDGEGDGDEEDEDEDEDEEDDEERPRRGSRGGAARPPRREPKPPPPPPPPEPPRLPARFVSAPAAPAPIELARGALEALKKAVGGRSFLLARRGLAARRAFERLGGLDPIAVPSLAGPFSDLMSLVLAPKPRLPLHIALGLLWEVDAAAFARVVSGWRAKMLSSPAEAAIGVLGATFDAVPDAEVAVHAGSLLVDRRLPPAAWARRYGKVRPFLAASLEKKGQSVGAFLRTLRPGADPVIRGRLAAAALGEGDAAS
jgi:predicted DNA-binding WGR domain protein